MWGTKLVCILNLFAAIFLGLQQHTHLLDVLRKKLHMQFILPCLESLKIKHFVFLLQELTCFCQLLIIICKEKSNQEYLDFNMARVSFLFIFPVSQLLVDIGSDSCHIPLSLKQQFSLWLSWFYFSKRYRLMTLKNGEQNPFVCEVALILQHFYSL